ncbi:hypothetical protein N9D33_01880 [Flavobacteriaceae bacterium]|nr:hypothetical protein [Flavobacteriaceae bacterium]
MKNLLLLSLCLVTVSCVSVKFPETLSVNVELDKESAKNLTEAINNSNYKTIMMTHHKEKGMTMSNEDNIILEFADELPNNVKEGVNQIKRIMVKGEKIGKGPNASKYMDYIPEVIIRRIENATEKGIDIKIDTVISENGEKKEIKIEVKTGNN